MKICTRCDQKANININILNYCNSCFEKQFIAKIENQLKNIDQRTSLMLCFPKSHDFFILRNALQIFFRKKMIKKIYILCVADTNIYELLGQENQLEGDINDRNMIDIDNDKSGINKFDKNCFRSSVDSFKEDAVSEDILLKNDTKNKSKEDAQNVCVICSNNRVNSNDNNNDKNTQNGENVYNREKCDKIYINPVFTIVEINDVALEWEYELKNGIVNKNIQEYCRNRSIKVICFAKSLESILTYALEKICSGDGIGAAKSVGNMIDNKNSSEIRLVNLFAGVKEKEIIYYLYLKKYLRSYKEKIESKTNYILKDFLLEIDNKNGLALFNILNTLKKLNNI